MLTLVIRLPPPEANNLAPALPLTNCAITSPLENVVVIKKFPKLFGSSSKPKMLAALLNVSVRLLPVEKRTCGVAVSENGGEDHVLQLPLGTCRLSRVDENPTVMTPSVIEFTPVEFGIPEMLISVVLLVYAALGSGIG